MPTLPSLAACNLMESCTGVDCCVQVYLLEKGFHVQLNIDPCKEVLNIEIERLPIQIELSDFEMSMLRFCFAPKFITVVAIASTIFILNIWKNTYLTSDLV